MAAVPEDLYERVRSTEDQGLRNELGLKAHEKECAIRYGHINDTMAGMKTVSEGIQRDLRTAATAGAGVMLAVLGFLIKLVFFP